MEYVVSCPEYIKCYQEYMHKNIMKTCNHDFSCSNGVNVLFISSIDT